MLLVPGLTWLEKENINLIFKHVTLAGLDQITTHAKILSYSSNLSDLYKSHFCSLNIEKLLQTSTLPTNSNSFLASPVQLVIHQNTITLQPPATLNILLSEAQQLCKSINDLITTDQWQISPITPTLWQITTAYPLDICLTPLWDAVGNLYPEMMVQGADKNILEKISTEIQMLLSTHTINQKRTTQNRPVINALWFWSPPSSDQNKTNSSYKDNIVWQQATGALTAPTSYSDWYSTLPQQSSDTQIAVLDELLYANKTQDIESYMDRLIDLDKRYFLPAWEALRTGKLKKLTIISHGCNGGQMILKPAYTRFFWRHTKKFNGTLHT